MRFALTALLSLACFAASATSVNAQKVDFNRDVRPIISNHCLACHGPDDAKRQAGLRLDDPDVATKILESGHAAIVAGNASASELVARITSDDESVRMPPAEFSKPLTPSEIATLKALGGTGRTVRKALGLRATHPRRTPGRRCSVCELAEKRHRQFCPTQDAATGAETDRTGRRTSPGAATVSGSDRTAADR